MEMKKESFHNIWKKGSSYRIIRLYLGLMLMVSTIKINIIGPHIPKWAWRKNTDPEEVLTFESGCSVIRGSGCWFDSSSGVPWPSYNRNQKRAKDKNQISSRYRTPYKNVTHEIINSDQLVVKQNCLLFRYLSSSHH
jgi:hypothetical protein